jgi:hypothetical protein
MRLVTRHGGVVIAFSSRQVVMNKYPVVAFAPRTTL